MCPYSVWLISHHESSSWRWEHTDITISLMKYPHTVKISRIGSRHMKNSSNQIIFRLFLISSIEILNILQIHSHSWSIEVRNSAEFRIIISEKGRISGSSTDTFGDLFFYDPLIRLYAWFWKSRLRHRIFMNERMRESRYSHIFERTNFAHFHNF